MLLNQVVATNAHYEPSIQLQELNTATKKVVEQCSVCMVEALDYLKKKYGVCLDAGGSGNKLKDIWKKIRFGGEDDRIRIMREKIRDAVHRLSLLRMLVLE